MPEEQHNIIGNQINEPVMQEAINNQRRSYKKISQIDTERFLSYYHGNSVTIKNAASRYEIPYQNAKKIIKKYNDSLNENIAIDRPGRGRPKMVTPEIIRHVETCVEENPGITLKNLKEKVNERSNMHLSKSTMDNILHTLLITLKKSSLVLDRVNSPEIILQRKEYARLFINEAPQDKTFCIFIDESGFNYHMRRERSRSRQGTRSSVIVPTVRGRKQTLIIASNQNSIIHSKLITDRTCNGMIFKEFIEELLTILNNNEIYNNAWIIMDNAQIHKIRETRNLIEISGNRLVFLAPYSYMLNPVENIFSKIKAIVRNSMTLEFNANNEINLQTLINDAINQITRQDCCNYVLNMMQNVALALQEHHFQ